MKQKSLKKAKRLRGISPIISKMQPSITVPPTFRKIVPLLLSKSYQITNPLIFGKSRRIRLVFRIRRRYRKKKQLYLKRLFAKRRRRIRIRYLSAKRFLSKFLRVISRATIKTFLKHSLHAIPDPYNKSSTFFSFKKPEQKLKTLWFPAQRNIARPWWMRKLHKYIPPLRSKSPLTQLGQRVKPLISHFNKRQNVIAYFPKRKRIRIFQQRSITRKFNKYIPPFRILIRQTRNNFFLTALDPKSYVRLNFSTGLVGLVGPRRSTVFAAEQVGRAAAVSLKKISFGLSLIIFRSKLSRHVKKLVHALSSNFSNIRGFFDLIPLPHNGLRQKKKRRL